MEDLLAGIKFILKSGWDFLDGIDVPGLGISFAYFFVGLFLLVLSIRIVLWALGISADASKSDLGTVEIGGFRDRSLKQLPGRK